MNEKQKALERVQLLLKKVDGNSSEEEARTSAHIAVKLILKHGLKISVPKPELHSEFMDEIEEVFRSVRQRAAERPAPPKPKPAPRRASEAYADPIFRSKPQPPPPPPRAKATGIHYEVNPAPRSMCCGYCGRAFMLADIVYRAHPDGICIHKECAPAYEAIHG